MSVGGVNQVENEPKRRASKGELDSLEPGGGSWSGVQPIVINNTTHVIRCVVDTELGNTENPVQNAAVNRAVQSKQDLLVSGGNIKTINGNSVLGSGDLEVGGGITVDEKLSSISTNPVENRAITAWLQGHALDRAQGTEASQDVEGYVNIQSLSVGAMGNQMIVNDFAGCTVPTTDTGSTDLKAVNSERLMNELGGYVKKSTDSLQVVNSYIEISKGANRYLKTWGGQLPSLDLGDDATPVSVPNTDVGSTGAAAVNSTRLKQEIAAIPIDDRPTAGSNNAVKSGGVWSKFDDVATDITTLSDVVSGKCDKSTYQGGLKLDSGGPTQKIFGFELTNAQQEPNVNEWQVCINFYAKTTMIGRLVCGTESDGRSSIIAMVRNTNGTDKYVTLARGDRPLGFNTARCIQWT